MAALRWKSFTKYEDRQEKPRRYGLTEIRAPSSSPLFYDVVLLDVFESMGEFVDGMKFSGGFNSLMLRPYIGKVTEMARKHKVYASSGDRGEHLVRKGSFQQYIECERLGFDIIDLNARSLELPEG